MKSKFDKDLNELRDEDGNLLSPELGGGIKNYPIDKDGTVCDDIPNEEPECMLTAEV